MADNNTIKTFTAADIEKYHKGLLSSKEMHELEKAVLDDPFLADALEGYAVPGVNVSEDITELKKRLAVRTEKSKVVPLAGSTKSSYLWLRIAAMVILIVGAGFLVYQFGSNNKKESNVALSPLKKAETKLPVETDNTVKSGTKNETEKITSSKPAEKEITTSTGSGSETKAKGLSSYDLSFSNTDSVADEEASVTTSKVASAPLSGAIEFKKMDDDKRDKEISAYKLNGDMYRDSIRLKQQNYSATYSYQSKANQPLRNIFRGRVTDSSNNPLPFANITNVTDNVGTYADAKGNFVLTSPDSVLNVHVRSVGFTNDNVTLRNYLAYNKVIMKEDYSNMEQVLISNNRNLNSSRSRNSTMVLEEPEPEDGWYNYDTYLANNLNIPETFRSKQPEGGSVEVSFEVDGNGEPINIKVEKSLCESCDKEAVRLVKDGPKFKRKAKKNGRTIVSVPF